MRPAAARLRGIARRALALAAAGAWLSFLAACGSSYAPEPDAPASDARPLASVYDLTLDLPDLVIIAAAGSGFAVDITLSIDPDTLDASGAFEGDVTVRKVTSGGVAAGWRAADPLPAHGRSTGDAWSLDPFGPVEVGSDATGWTALFLRAEGTLSADGRTLSGIAGETASGTAGTFFGVKQRRYLVAATDFGVTGTVSLVTVRYNVMVEVDRDLESVSGDPVVRASDGGVFVVNRFFYDNVQSLDPAAKFATALQFSTGNASNPHDVLAVDADRLFITRYEPPFNDLLIASRANGATLGFVDLSPLATNASGTPRADGLAQAEGLVFAGLQNIDASFVEYGPGRVAAIDPAGGAIRAAITLQGKNPFGPPARHPATGDLYYACAGVFQGSLPGELSGGIEVVDPRALVTRGLLVDDDDLGGNVSAVALSTIGGGAGSPVTGYALVTFPSGSNALRAFDPATGAVPPGVVYTSSAFLTEAVADGDGYILVPEHDAARPRLLIFDAGSGAIVAAPALSLPPFSVAVLTRELRR
jgi:hypothetical protein